MESKTLSSINVSLRGRGASTRYRKWKLKIVLLISNRFNGH